MSANEQVQPEGEKIRKALRWVSDTIQSFPEKKREAVLQEAQVRFDLSPKECEFLNKEFC